MTQCKLEWKINGLDVFKSFESFADMNEFASILLKQVGDIDVVVKAWLTVNINGVNEQGDKFRHDFCKLSEI